MDVTALKELLSGYQERFQASETNVARILEVIHDVLGVTIQRKDIVIDRDGVTIRITSHPAIRSAIKENEATILGVLQKEGAPWKKFQ